MIQADRVYSTPPVNTSSPALREAPASDNPRALKLTRRSVVAVLAAGATANVPAIAAAGLTDNSSVAADSIFEAIRAHCATEAASISSSTSWERSAT
jgi:hypothetical protein